MGEIKEEAQGHYDAIDIFRIIAAVLVVMLHITPFRMIPCSEALNMAFQDYICKIAVPFFFIVSGFFFFKKQDIQNLNVPGYWKYIKKLALMYIFWSVLYLPLSIKNMLPVSEGILKAFLVYIRNFIFVGSYHHLWYMSALIIAQTLVFFLMKKKFSPWIILMVSGIFYMAGLLWQSYFGLFEIIGKNFPDLYSDIEYLMDNFIVTTRDGLFEGFLFVSLGMLLAYGKISFTKKADICGLLITSVLLAVEIKLTGAYNLSKARDMYIFLPAVSVFLFDLLLKADFRYKGNPKTIRGISSLIYFMHLLVNYFLAEFFKLIKKEAWLDKYRFLMVLAVTFLISLAVTVIKNRYGSRVLANNK